jgi:hypothetical protein
MQEERLVILPLMGSDAKFDTYTTPTVPGFYKVKGHLEGWIAYVVKVQPGPRKRKRWVISILYGPKTTLPTNEIVR